MLVLCKFESWVHWLHGIVDGVCEGLMLGRVISIICIHGSAVGRSGSKQDGILLPTYRCCEVPLYTGLQSPVVMHPTICYITKVFGGEGADPARTRRHGNCNRFLYCCVMILLVCNGYLPLCAGSTLDIHIITNTSVILNR